MVRIYSPGAVIVLVIENWNLRFICIPMFLVLGIWNFSAL